MKEGTSWCSVSNEREIEGFAAKKRKSEELFENQNPFGLGLRDCEEQMYMHNEDEVQKIPSYSMPPNLKVNVWVQAVGGKGKYTLG